MVNRLKVQFPGWYRAMTLTERAVTPGSAKIKNRIKKSMFVMGKKRLQEWQSQSPFSNDSYFSQRLEMAGITRDELLYLLSESPGDPGQRFPVQPAWLTEFIEAFSSPADSVPIPIPEGLKSIEAIHFLRIIEPLIHQARRRLHKGIGEIILTTTDLPFAPDTVEDIFLESLLVSLMVVLSRTMVLELNVARLQGMLRGDTPAQRFKSFLEYIRLRDAGLKILEEYPALVRQTVIRINKWLESSLEFIGHLRGDWHDILTTFNFQKNPGVLTRLRAAGDTHRGGRAVTIAEFSSGFRVVYKPRSLAVEVHFQELLNWLNERGDHPPFGLLNILDRGNYGWVEFIAHTGCDSVAELKRFYQRQGGFLALLFALQATDFHYENLIAAGEYPFLLDLESLFHTNARKLVTSQSEQLAGIAIENSVMKVGLLPQRVWLSSEYEGLDLSGLAAEAGQLFPDRLLFMGKEGTDEMRFSRKQAKMPAGHNHPTLKGAKVNLLDYKKEIIKGFTIIYYLIMEHREEFLSPNGPLVRFAGDEVRVLLRPTRTYGLLLNESFHPDLLRDALDRDQFFDKLWIEVEDSPYLARVIPGEQEDLQKGDIPLFITRPNSRNLWDSSGTRTANFFDEPGMVSVQRRIRQFSEEHFNEQLWYIHASLAALSMNFASMPMRAYPVVEPGVVPPFEQLREQLVITAEAAGDQLEKWSLQGKNDASWLGLTLGAKDRWTLLPLSMDLYTGLPGIILFLAYLGAVTQKHRCSALAEAALITLRRQIERSKSSLTRIGAFLGWGGVIYTLTHLAILWNKPTLLAEVEDIVKYLPALIEKNKHFDIIAGAAGCIGALIAYYRCTSSKGALDAAIQCGWQLVDLAKSMEQGIGWVPEIDAESNPNTKPLAGFSHGTAGIAWALAELFAVTGEERFRNTAIGAIEYERGVFSLAEENWPDLRRDENEDSTQDKKKSNFMTAWCHGAPGIGLSRLHISRHINDEKMKAEIDTALKTTLARGFGRNHSLCHGDNGNLDLLLQASIALDDCKWRFQVNRMATIILESIKKHGWLYGVGVETPGLMVGLAGIGYGLLRLAEPKRVPSVLILEPPNLPEKPIS